MIRTAHMAIRINYRSLMALIFAASGLGTAINAQNITREVHVVTSYRPKVADVDKISSLPEIKDTFTLKTNIEYSVLPTKIKSDYSLRPIKEATMSNPLDKLYKSRLKVGFGSYYTPLVEYSIQNLRSSEYAVGAYAFHKSSYDKLALTDYLEVPSNYGKTNLMVYGKKFYRKINVTADAGADRYSYRYYGISDEYITIDTVDGFLVDGQDIRQNYNKIWARAGIHSNESDSGRIDYSLSLRGDYFWDRYEISEPHVGFKGNVNFPIKTFRLSLDGEVEHYVLKKPHVELPSTLYTVHPVFSKRKDQWSIRIGGRVSILQRDTVAPVYIYPDVDFRFKILGNYLSTFMGVTGYLEHYSYEEMSKINPYIIPGQEAFRINHPYVFFAGIDGYLSRKASYRFNIEYEAISGMPFYVNYVDSINFRNQFIMVEDNPDRIRLHLEFNWVPLPELELLLRSNYYSYTLYIQEHPWHMPNFDLSFTTRYNYREKFYAELDFILLGKRYAATVNEEGVFEPSLELDPVYDLNLKLEYRYSDILSFFLQGNNLINQHYYLWNQYRSHGFNVLGGISYKF
ncbi:MAG: hypothetical protein JW801_16345 [Bacteroidales bacterium]|nr:hypothetical protein [Bacteroidales bacterium]